MSIKNEYNIFLSAVQFLTRIKVPGSFVYKQEYLQQSSRYFPLVGIIVGAISALIYLVLNKYLSNDLAILGYMLTSIWITGAFHEDGLADVCDAFGGGWNKEKILVIMKDSRLGTFGLIGLLAAFAAKFLLLKELPGFMPPEITPSLNPLVNYKTMILLMIAAHSLSRFMPVTIIQQYAYVADTDLSKSKPLSNSVLSPLSLAFGLLFAVLPLLFLSPWYLLVLVPMYLCRTSLARFFVKWIGGYTGDCLGATQQVTEIVFYLSALIIWRYIV
jgi:adenosylcobinamide-GDP ribazoletransferase